MLAEQKLPATAVEAFSAELRIVRTDALAELEVFDVLPHACDHADGFMTGDQGEFGQELALVDMQVGPADAASLDLDEDIIVSQFGEVNLDEAVFFRLGVPAGERMMISQVD